jgi:hypothetical protein
MKKLIMTTLCLLVALPGWAIEDPTPNTIGVYLDLQADERCLPFPTDALTELTMYLLVTNPTFGTLSGFEAAYYFDGIAELNSVTFAHPGGVDAGGLGNNLVTFPTPMPTSQVTLLATITGTYLDFEYGPAVLKLVGTNLPVADVQMPVVIMENGERMEMSLSFGDGATVFINAGCEPVAAESQTLGSVKSLYR